MEWYQRNPEKYRALARKYQRELTPEKRAKRGADRTIRTNIKRQLVLDYLLAHPCSCGEADPVCLQFHHRDPETKVNAVANLVHGTNGIEKLKIEMEKCDVLCSNCHLKLHAQENGFFKSVKNS